MNIKKLSDGEGYELSWKLVEARVYNEWYQFFNPKKWNWITFHFARIGFDYDRFGPLFSFDFTFAGIGFYISFNPPWETKQSKEIQKRANDIEIDPDRHTSELGDIESDINDMENEGGNVSSE